MATMPLAGACLGLPNTSGPNPNIAVWPHELRPIDLVRSVAIGAARRASRVAFVFAVNSFFTPLYVVSRASRASLGTALVLR